MATADDLIVGYNDGGGIRGRLNDLSDEAFGDDLLLAFLTEAQKDLATVGVFQTIKTITPDGSNAYVSLNTTNLTYLPISVLAVKYNGTALDFAPLFESKYWDPASGTPTAYTLWSVDSAKRAYFDTIPSASYTLEFWFTYIPTDLAAITSTILCPPEWFPALEAYVEWRCRAKEGNEMANTARAEYDSLKAQAAMVNEIVLRAGGSS